MMWAALTLAVVVFIVVLVVALFRPRTPEPPLDPEAAMQAAVELHRIDRRLDVEWTKRELRRDADELEHSIEEIIGDDDEP
jgi:hypothetical protein